MKTDSAKYSRRSVLKRLGIGAGFLPLLHAERSRAATASGFPTRFISITWTDGITPPNFYPTGAAGPITTLPDTLSPLATWSSKVLMMRSANKQTSPIDLKGMVDIGMTYGGHFTYPSLLTGAASTPDGGKTVTANGPSIDQVISDYLSSSAGVSNAQLNVGCRPYGSSTSWRGAGQKNSSQTDPYKLFTSLFSGTTMPVAQVNALFQRRKSVLDSVSTELTNFSKNLGTDDKVKVQSHLDSVRQLEMQMQSSTTTTGTCTAPTITPTGLNFNTITNYQNHVTFMSDLVAAAVVCGKARSVTMDLIDNGGGNSLTFPWLSISSPDFHAIAHQGSANYSQKSVIDKWFYKQCVAEVVGKLAAVQEGSGTALDNTVILVSNDMNEGSQHYVGSIPYLLIGSCGGFFKTGRTVTFPSQMPHNQLLTSVLHAMGVKDSTGALVGGVGDAKYAGNLDAQLTM